jgi:hypothetical protein
VPSGQGPGSRTHPDVFEFALRLYFERDFNASRIAEEINKKFGLGTITARGVGKWLRAWRRDASGPWDFGSSDPETSRVVLSVLAELIELDIWAAQSLTNAEADLLARLAVVAPDMPRDAMYLWARQFLARQATGSSVGDLLSYLAFRPWTDEGVRYQAAADRAHITDLLGFGRDLRWMTGEPEGDRSGLTPKVTPPTANTRVRGRSSAS